jgi:hypothetical protein
MANSLRSIKIYFFPYLLILITLIAISSVIQFLLKEYIKIAWFDFDFVFTFIVPATVSIYTTYKLIKNKLDTIQDTNSDSKFGLKPYLTVLLFIPVLGSQYYVSDKLYKVIDINNIEMINDYPSDKYFRIKEYKIDKQPFGNHLTKTNIRHTKSIFPHGFVLNAYVLFNFLNSDSFIWFGLNYEQRYTNGESSSDEQLIKTFTLNADNYIKENIKYNDKLFTRVSHSAKKLGYLNAIRNKIPSILPIQIEILEPGIQDLNQLRALMLRVFLSIFSICNLIVLVYSLKLREPKS